jgi:hypothetical protein
MSKNIILNNCMKHEAPTIYVYLTKQNVIKENEARYEETSKWTSAGVER